ncbi:hypothetical protein JCM19236_5404 [Vibrio sp. JCM 19236]|nr:hypothetical protein JCM19236_5404 [Vibrio sp. JCM 19236]
MILGGDFNTWSDSRSQALRKAMNNAGLIEVSFEPDNRSRFMDGEVLDHIYYRGLELKKQRRQLVTPLIIIHCWQVLL